MASTVPGQLLAAIKGRKFTSVARLFASGADFQGWTPSGHWIADEPSTIAKIIEVWFSPGAGSTVTWSNEVQSGKNSAALEFEITWRTEPDDQPRVLRQVYLMTIKNDKIVSARVYCPGLHTEFPEVDLEKQRRSKGLTGAKPLSNAKAITTKAS
jgi:hypothetical protein